MNKYIILLVALTLCAPIQIQSAGLSVLSVPSKFVNRLATTKMAISQTFVTVFAQVSIDGPIDNFLKFLGKLLLLVAVAMLCYSSFLFHDGKNREGVFSLIGAFVLAVAVPAAKIIFN